MAHEALLLISWPPDISGAWLVGLGAMLAGAGSLLSGIAALRASRRQGAKEAKESEAA